MAKSKLDFIRDLLENHKIPDSEKERFFRLASKELKQYDDQVWEELRMLKNYISNLKENTSKNKNEKKLRKHSPKDVAEFMSFFDHREKLKYLTHNHDKTGHFDIENFLIEAEKIFDKDTKNKLNIPQSLWKLVKNFAFESKLGERDKGGNKIYWRGLDGELIEEGWSKSPSVERIKNSPKHKQIHPIDTDFKEVINKFRRVTRIKSTEIDPQLKKLIKDAFDKIIGSNNSEFNIEISENINNANFYCHVPSLKKAIEVIFEEFRDHGKKEILVECERSYIEKYRTYTIRFIQVESFLSKNIEDFKKEIFDDHKGKGGIGTIKYNLNGYCNYSIETKIVKGSKKESVRFNVLKDNNGIKDVENIIVDVRGFTHLLTFFKK